MKKNYFVTGATGAVGSALISTLLESTDCHIWMLMRAESEGHMQQRLQQLFSFWALDTKQCSNAQKRITLIQGDMDSPQFGIADIHYQNLSKQCTHIIHCAGVVRMNLPLEVATTHALGSAKNVIELALACKKNGQLQKIDVVSTVGVGGKMQISLPEAWITEQREFHNTYEASKAAAEDYLQQEIKLHQLPATIHRPSMVVGDSVTGKIIHFQVFYHLCEFLAGRRTFGLSPLYGNAILDTVPVDYVANVIVWSSQNQATINKIFHLSSGPELAIKLTELQSLIKEMMLSKGLKLPIKIAVPTPLFLFLLKLLTPLLPQKLRRAVKTLPIFLDYLNDEQLFVNTESRNFIEHNGGPTLPLWQEYLTNVIQHYLHTQAK